MSAKKASKKAKRAPAKKRPAEKAKRKTAAPKKAKAPAAKKTTPASRKPKAIKGKPKAIKGKPKAIKGKPKAIKGKPKAIKGKPKAIKGKPKAISRPARRRDATGHIDPQYAADLRAKALETRDTDGSAYAFLEKARSRDEFAEELGEEAVAEMTSGEDQRETLLDLEVSAEQGGPFVETRGREEYARGTDASNPRSATREPFPKT